MNDDAAAKVGVWSEAGRLGPGCWFVLPDWRRELTRTPSRPSCSTTSCGLTGPSGTGLQLRLQDA